MDFPLNPSLVPASAPASAIVRLFGVRRNEVTSEGIGRTGDHLSVSPVTAQNLFGTAAFWRAARARNASRNLEVHPFVRLVGDL
jgi:hypothetical protein